MPRSLAPLVVPLVFLSFMAALRLAHGEFWRASSFDPDYAYLLNAQSISDLQPPGHIDHPGTPVQIFGAVILRALRSSNALVVENPEFYLTVLAWSWCVVLAMALWWFGKVALEGGVGVGGVMLAQAAPLASAPVLFASLMRFNPDSLLMALGLAIAAVLIRGGDPGDRRVAAICGLLAGLAAATKMSFVGVAIGLLPVFGLRAGLVYLATLGAAAIIVTAPIWPKLIMVLYWAAELVIRPDVYASGEPSIPLWRRVVANIPLRSQMNPALVAAILVGVHALWVSRGGDRGANAGRWRQTLVGLTTALALQLLISTKFTFERYLIPALALTGATFIVSHRVAPLAVRWRLAIVAVVVAVFMPAARQQWQSISRQNADFQEVETAHRTMPSDCLLIGSYPTSTLPFALAFGNVFASYRYSDQLRKIYPGFVYHDFLEKWYRDWDRPQDPREIYWRRGCAVERGATLGGYAPPEGMRIARELVRESDAVRLLEPVALPAVCEVRYGDGWLRSGGGPADLDRLASGSAFIVVASPEATQLTITANQTSSSLNARVETLWNGDLIGVTVHYDGSHVPVRHHLNVNKGWNRLMIRSVDPAAKPLNHGDKAALRWSQISISAPGCKIVE